MLIQGDVKGGQAAGSPPPVPDLMPFVIEPIILARLHRANVHPAVAGVLAGAITFVTVTWTALVSGLFYVPTTKSHSWWHSFWLFILHDSDVSRGHTVPYLEDYPSMVLTITIAVSVYLVYAIYGYAAVLHTDMDRADCISTTPEGREALSDAVVAINTRFALWGRWAPLALLLCLVAATLIDFRLEGRLFTFLHSGNLYRHWWASLTPFRAGGPLWVLFGALGIYMVYAEAILGLTYVRFLRTCRNDYRFRANMLNPDGLFGWTRIRRIVSNLEAGVLCTVLSSWALSFYLQPAVGSVITVAVLALFDGIVFYVFISVTWNFRRQVKTDKGALRAKIGSEISSSLASSDIEGLLKTLVAYKRLELVSNIPSVPIRPRWLIVGGVTVLIPLAALIVQILSYFAGK